MVAKLLRVNIESCKKFLFYFRISFTLSFSEFFWYPRNWKPQNTYIENNHRKMWKQFYSCFGFLAPFDRRFLKCFLLFWLRFQLSSYDDNFFFSPSHVTESWKRARAVKWTLIHSKETFSSSSRDFELLWWRAQILKFSHAFFSHLHYDAHREEEKFSCWKNIHTSSERRKSSWGSEKLFSSSNAWDIESRVLQLRKETSNIAQFLCKN